MVVVVLLVVVRVTRKLLSGRLVFSNIFQFAFFFIDLNFVTQHFFFFMILGFQKKKKKKKRFV